MKPVKIVMTSLLLLALAGRIPAAEVIEEIYAVVNGEIITYSELKNAENDWIRQLQSRYQGDELNQAIARMKKELLDTFIERKLLISEAKRHNYDVSSDVDVMIKEIMKQNNFNTEEELKAALRREGLDYQTFREQQKLYRMQQRLIYEEVTSKIKIDNAEIMAYYKNHLDDYTLPARYDLNAVYLNSANYSDEAAMETRAQEVLTALQQGKFVDVATKFTDLGSEKKSIHLGEFKAGEMDPELEKAAAALKPGQVSDWVHTENGWYLLELVSFTPSRLVKYEEVRDRIRNTILAQRHEVKQKEYLDTLKKKSYIRIYKRWA